LKAEDLIDVIGETDEKYISDVKDDRRKRIPRRMKWAAGVGATACMTLLVAASGRFSSPEVPAEEYEDLAPSSGGVGHAVHAF